MINFKMVAKGMIIVMMVSMTKINLLEALITIAVTIIIIAIIKAIYLYLAF